MKLSFVKQNVLQRRVSKLLLPTAGKIKQTGATCLETGAPNDNFRKNICSEDDLRSRIFGTFVVKFLA